MTTDPLLDAIDALTRPRRVLLLRDDSSTDRTEVPSLLEQLEDSIGQGGEQMGGGAFGSRLPIAVDIRDTLADWRDVVRYELLSCEIAPHADGGLRQWLMQIVTASPPAPLDPPVLPRWARIVEGWVRRAEELLGLLDETAPRRLRDTRCPSCQASHVRVDDKGQLLEAGRVAQDEFRAPCLLLRFERHVLQSITCQACGDTWFGRSGIWQVGELLEEQRRAAVERAS